MRRPAYDSNVAFEGKIKSMRLISEMIGFGPMPAPDREVEQRLTLNSRGEDLVQQLLIWGWGKAETSSKRMFNDFTHRCGLYP